MIKSFAFSGVLLVSILVCTFIGYKIDEWLGTMPIFILISLAYSIGGSIYLLIHKMRS